MPPKLLFSSRQMPAHLSETAKFKLWRDIYVGEIAALDISVAEDRPFVADMEAMAVGNVLLTRVLGTVTGVTRTASHVAAERHGDYCLLINTGPDAMGGTFRQNDFSIAPGAAALQTFAEPLKMVGGHSNSWTNVIVPRALLAEAFDHVDDRLSVAIGSSSEPLAMLGAYCAMVEQQERLTSPDLLNHMAETIVDLVGLAIGVKGDAAEIAGTRGLRAARLAAITARIRNGFADPSFTAASIALDLRLSLRYVHDLLQESGNSFSERVLALRLQRAMEMLTDRSFDHLRIGQIAYASGFSDVSYFNRSFRRRFGCTPSMAR
jgi:AraC-like DNA-binding protein